MDNTPPIPRRSRKFKLVRTLLVIAILAAAGIGARYISTTRPTARQRPPQAAVALVEVTAVQPSSAPVVLQAMGTVIPAREITLTAQVSGEVIKIHPEFVEGGFLSEGSEILRIDPLDYQLAVTRLKGEVARTRFELDLELGRQDVARREWDLLTAGKPTAPGEADLALRKPHLAKARAELAAAEANLQQAHLNLTRTTLRAPFNAIVRTRHVERGSQVAPQTPLANPGGHRHLLGPDGRGGGPPAIVRAAPAAGGARRPRRGSPWPERARCPPAGGTGGPTAGGPRTRRTHGPGPGGGAGPA